MGIGISTNYFQRSALNMPAGSTAVQTTDIAFNVTAGQRVILAGAGFYAGSTSNVLSLSLTGSVTFSDFNFLIQSAVTLANANADRLVQTALGSFINLRVSNFPGNLHLNGYIYPTSTGIITLQAARVGTASGTCFLGAGTWLNVLYL